MLPKPGSRAHKVALYCRLVIQFLRCKSRDLIAHFSIEVPAKWFVSDLSQGNHGDADSKMVIESPFFSAIYIEIFAHEFEGADAASWINWGVQKAQSSPGYQRISYQAYKVSQYSGYLHEYQRPNYSPLVKIIWGNSIYHCIDWYTFNDLSLEFVEP